VGGCCGGGLVDGPLGAFSGSARAADNTTLITALPWWECWCWFPASLDDGGWPRMAALAAGAEKLTHNAIHVWTSREQSDPVGVLGAAHGAVPVPRQGAGLRLHRSPLTDVPPGGYPSGQRGQTVNLLAHAFAGSNPAPPICFGLRRVLVPTAGAARRRPIPRRSRAPGLANAI
jgi:hypothetical protein